MSAASGDVLELIKETLLGDADFNGELENWCVQRCGAFSNSLEGGEHKLEWTTLHEEFSRLFEAKITSILQQNDASVEEFWQKLTKAADGDEGLLGEAFLLQCLAAVVDYDQFVVTMRSLHEMRANEMEGLSSDTNDTRIDAQVEEGMVLHK